PMAGYSTLDLSTGITRNSPYGRGDADIVLDKGASLSGTANLDPGANVRFTGDGTLAGYTIDANSGGTVTIDSSLTTDLNGRGSKINLFASPDLSSPAVAINRYADSNTVVTMGSGNVEIAHPEQFHGTVDWSPSG